MADIDRIIIGYNGAKDAAAYEEALVLDEEQTEGDDYRLIISESYPGAFPNRN